MKNSVHGGFKKPGSSGVNVPSSHKGSVPGNRASGISAGGNGPSAVKTAKTAAMSPSAKKAH